MADLEAQDLISFDDLVTPRIMPFVFWLLEAANVVFWIGALVPRTVTQIEEALDPETGKVIAAHADYHWTTIFTYIILLVVFAVLIRVFCDLVLCIFRWQASTRGILMALTGAPAQMAVSQGAPVTPGPAAAAQTPAVTPQPPWEQPPQR